MAKINDNFQKLPGSYLFSEIAHRVRNYQTENPDKQIIRMGIGDVTLPLTSSVINSLHLAVEDMSKKETFMGYGPEQGYNFLIETIIKNDFNSRGVSLENDEVFISDGAKSDTGNIGDILSLDNIIAVTDPVYPVYVDTNVMAGRAGDLLKSGRWSNIVYLECNAENNFVPSLPKEKVDVIYLCFPNNPTGTTLTKSQLKTWVDYALKNQCLILFDAAYEAFITEDNVPHSIYEIEGAKQCAIEFRSFSKTAGFTGTRCGYTVIPKTVLAKNSKGEDVMLNKLWNRRQCTKFNGTSYIIQKAAQAVYSDEGKKETRMLIEYYLNNAKVIREGLTSAGYTVFGGVNSPYIWAQTPKGMDSWQFFDYLLKEKNIVATPGVGFGISGEGYIRFSALGDKDLTVKAMERLKK